MLTDFVNVAFPRSTNRDAVAELDGHFSSWWAGRSDSAWPSGESLAGQQSPIDRCASGQPHEQPEPRIRSRNRPRTVRQAQRYPHWLVLRWRCIFPPCDPIWLQPREHFRRPMTPPCLVRSEDASVEIARLRARQMSRWVPRHSEEAHLCHFSRQKQPATSGNRARKSAARTCVRRRGQQHTSSCYVRGYTCFWLWAPAPLAFRFYFSCSSDILPNDPCRRLLHAKGHDRHASLGWVGQVVPSTSLVTAPPAACIDWDPITHLSMPVSWRGRCPVVRMPGCLPRILIVASRKTLRGLGGT